MRTAAALGALAVLPLLLAGCSSDTGPTTFSPTGPPPGASSTSGTGTGGPLIVEVPPPTDTLHLAAAPALALRAPTAAEPNETALPYTGPNLLPGASELVWSHTLATPTSLLGMEAHVWVRVTEQLVSTEAPGAPCAWELVVRIVSPGGDPPDTYGIQCSPPAGPTVAPGDYELVFSADQAITGPVAATRGDAVELHLRRNAFSPSPDDAVFVLTGAAAFDSRIRLDGLKE